MNINKNKIKDVVTVANKTFGFLKLSEAKLSPNNIRPEISKDEAELIKVTLLPSIKAIGLQQLPVCTPEGEVFIGGRRWKAYELKGESWLPVEIRDTDAYDQMRDSWAENRARKDVEPLEEARHFQKMMKTKGVGQDKLAEELGLPEIYISDRIRVLKTVTPAGGEVVEGHGLTDKQKRKTITFEKARTLSRDWIPQPTREKLVKKIKEEGLSQEDLQRELGKGKAIQDIIEAESKPEVKEKLEKQFGGENAFEVEPEEVLAKQRELLGLAPSLDKAELEIEQFETDQEKVDVNIHPKVMQRIVKYFLDRKGRYVGYKVVVDGELPKGKKEA